MPDLARSARPLQSLKGLAVLACAFTTLGCASWLGIEPRHENKLVSHYDRIAIEVAQLDPTVGSEVQAPTMGVGREIVPPKIEDRWLLTLAELIRIGLENNKVIRQNAQFMSPNNPLLQNPDGVPSVFDPAIQNSGVLYGARGTAAALSDFDPRLTVVSKWGDDQTASNSVIPPIPPNRILDNNTQQLQTRLDQQLLGGGVFTINQNWNYSYTNQPGQLFNSSYTGQLGAEFRQPLWAGSGKAFTSIAGPSIQRARGFSNVSQGIVIAQINKRLSEIDLQENLQNLVREIGELYWDLYQNYQDYESEHATAESAKELWDTMASRSYQENGIDIAQAEDTYYDSRGREELALSNLYLTEAKLRRLVGLPIDDARVIFPSDLPREDDVTLNRAKCLYEALCSRLELTRQKTNLHSLELQLVAARKLVAPRLDFISGYSLNGFGHNFLNPNTDNFNSAVSNLYSGKETSWSAGFEYSIPLWLRQEKAQVHQLEFRIAKARAGLAAQEDEIAHELNTVLIQIKRSHGISQQYRHRLQAATRRVLAAKSTLDTRYKNSDQYLRSLTSQAQARSSYYRSVTEYNKSLRDLLYRTGRLLPADGISLVGVDGLPLISPSEPMFENLIPPSPPDSTSPTDEAPESEENPQPNEQPTPDPKSKKRKPVAELDSPTISGGPVFEMPVIVDQTTPDADTEEMAMEPPIPIPVSPPGEDSEFVQPILPASDSR